MPSFWEISQRIDAEVKLEAALADIQRVNGDVPFQSRRSKGILSPRDPINQFKAHPSAKDLNIVWITGMWSGKMPGTGRYAELLAPLGYNIKVVNTIAAPVTASAGRISRVFGFAPRSLQDRGQKHIDTNVEKYHNEVGQDYYPDIIVGSSQGGAVALRMASSYPEVPMLLLCPAYRIFHITPTYMNRGSILIHGYYDEEVPIEDSEFLSKKFDVPLIVTPDAHIIKRGFWQVVRSLEILTNRVLAAKERAAV